MKIVKALMRSCITQFLPNSLQHNACLPAFDCIFFLYNPIESSSRGNHHGLCESGQLANPNEGDWFYAFNFLCLCVKEEKLKG